MRCRHTEKLDSIDSVLPRLLESTRFPLVISRLQFSNLKQAEKCACVCGNLRYSTRERVSSSTSNLRVVKEPIHSYIAVSDPESIILNDRLFQRLHPITQNGT